MEENYNNPDKEVTELDPEEVQEEQADADNEDKDKLPFDPNIISIETKVYPLDVITRRLQQNTLILNPDFQRKEVWTPEKRSQLVESLLLRIPIPMIYLSSDDKGNLSVVDGLQRLSTIRDFVLGEKFMNSINPETMRGDESLRGYGFKLKHMEYLTDYDGLTFCQLPLMMQNRILETQFQFTVINTGTPEEVKRTIFKRINTGGTPLTSQEIRNALYIGNATQLLNDLSKLDAFKRATNESIKGKRMEDKELILRLVAFMLRDYKAYSRTVTADTWLGDTMIILNAMPGLDSRDYRKLQNSTNASLPLEVRNMTFQEIENFFRNAMERCHVLFGKHAFRKSYGDQKLAPINRCLFEMWGYIIGSLSGEEFNTLISKQNDFLIKYWELLEDSDFQKEITRDSLKHISVKSRFKKLIYLTNEYANSNLA